MDVRFRFALLLFLLRPSAAAAEPISLTLPPGRPTPEQLAQAEPGVTLNAEVLQRYGFSLAQYNKMGREDQDRVEQWIRILETEKRKAAARAAAGTSGQPKPPVQNEGTQAALTRMRQAAAAPSSYFDGTSGGASAVGGSYFTPRLQVLGAGTMQPDGSMTPGGIRKFSLLGPNGLHLDAGSLGLDQRGPLVGVSPYVGVGKEGSGSGRRLDYDWKAQAYAVDWGARLYPDDNPTLDARIDQGVAGLKNLDPTIGIKPEDVGKLQNRLAFSHDFESQWLFYGSALGRVGRAYSLFPGVDVGWSTMGLLRMSGYFPNVTTDQTVGARVSPGAGQHVGLFGGLTEAVGLFNQTVISDSINGEKLATDVHPDFAPHAEVAAWGKIPYLSNGEYTLSAGRQWNPWTTLTSVSAGVAAPVGGGVKVGAFGRYSDESGFDGDFDRQKAAAGLTVSPAPGLSIFGQYNQDTAKLGTAEIDNKGVMFGLTISETTKGPARGASVTLESLFGGRDQLVSSDEQAAFVKQLQSMLDVMLALKGAILSQTGGVQGGWAAVQKGWGELSPAMRQELSDAWAQYLPNQPPLDKILGIGGKDLSKLDDVVNLLSDTKVLERLMVRALRAEILKSLSSVDIPLLGKTRLSAPMVLAAANAYSLGLTPLPPVTANDQQTLNAFLLNKLGGQAGCPAGSAADATKCILGKIPPEVAAQLQKIYGGDLSDLLKGAVDWPSGVLRREMNRMLLQVMLAAESLNELSADQGEKIADLDVRGLMGSFARLDARSRREQITVLKSAVDDLKAELAEQDRALRERMTVYGSARLSWLQGQPAWPSNVQIAIAPADWPQLLAIYGDAKLFDLILRCKAGLAAAHPTGPARLMITLDRTPLGALSLRRGDPMVLSLPPRAADLSLFDLNF